MRLSAVSPAPVLDTLALVDRLAPGHRYARKAALLQLAQSDTTGFRDADRLVAVIGFYPERPERRGETLLTLWFICRPEAGRCLVALHRIARLTLARLRDTPGVRIRAEVRAGDRTGQRLARLMGLTAAGGRDGDEHWEWASDDKDRQIDHPPLHRRR